ARPRSRGAARVRRVTGPVSRPGRASSPLRPAPVTHQVIPCRLMKVVRIVTSVKTKVVAGTDLRGALAVLLGPRCRPAAGCRAEARLVLNHRTEVCTWPVGRAFAIAPRKRVDRTVRCPLPPSLHPSDDRHAYDFEARLVIGSRALPWQRQT